MFAGKDLRFALFALLAMVAGCQLPLDHAACPCAEGWVCCPTIGVCVAAVDQCPDGTGSKDAGDDAPMSDGGDSITEIQRLQMDHGWLGDQMGAAGVLRDDLAVVGVPGRAGTVTRQGMVVVFERRGAGVWVRVAALSSPSPVAAGRFGSKVALIGSQQLLVGAPGEAAGRVYLFQRTVDGWVLQQTIEPDVTGLTADQIAALHFGVSLAADAERVAIGTAGTTAEVYDITPAGATHLVRLAAPLYSGWVAALAGSSVVIVGNAPNGVGLVYVYDEALGWTNPTLVTHSAVTSQVAFDGQRLAVGVVGGLRIIERSASGWTAPVDVALPGATQPQVDDLGWRSGELDVLTEVDEATLYLGRARSIGGVWQADPPFLIGPTRGGGNRIMTSGDRVMVGLPLASVSDLIVGLANIYRVDDAGFAADATIAFDDKPLSTLGWIAAGGGQLLATAGIDQISAWFVRDPSGAYQRRPSLVLPGDDLNTLRQPAVAGSHVIFPVAARDGTLALQTFELGAHDWTTGPRLPAADGVDVASSGALAIDGDIAAVGGAWSPPRSGGAVVVYAWREGAWQVAAEVDTGLRVTSSVALSGHRLAVIGDALIRLFARLGDTWYEMPAPSLGEPTSEILRVFLAGDVLGVASTAVSDGHVATDVFRWTDGHWRSELHVRSDQSTIACQFVCNFGLAALDTDRLVVFRDAVSVAAYQFAAGAWGARAPIALASLPSAPDAHIAQAAFADGALALWVVAEGDGLSGLAGAVHVFRWP